MTCETLLFSTVFGRLHKDVQQNSACHNVVNKIIKGTSVANLELKLETFPINEVLLEIEKEFRSLIDEKKVNFFINFVKCRKNVLIHTDRQKFHDILRALVSNAVNFTEKGQISITVIKVNDRFKIQVSDTGIGIPSDKFEYIFEQFFNSGA